MPTLDINHAPDRAVYLSPADNVAAIIGAQAAGSKFIFGSGVYDNLNIIPKDGDAFIGENGVIFRGSIPITGWVKQNGYWSAAGFPAPGFSPGTADTGREGLAQNPKDLYVNGIPYLRVGSLSAVGAGDFYSSDGRVYISDDPTDKTTTASKTAVAFNGDNTRGVTIENITVEQYASIAQHGAIEAHGSSGWNLVDVNAIYNHGDGLAGGNDMTVIGGSYSNNGEEGIEDYSASNIVINGVTLDGNNYARYSPGWDAGGIKMLLSTNITIENSDISNNIGNGLWLDTDNQYVSIVNNTIENNNGIGIEYETSFDAKISGNNIGYNARSGSAPGYWGSDLLVQNSQDVVVTKNLIIADGGEGIGMIDDTRPAGVRGPYGAINNRVMYNTIVMLKAGLNGGASDGGPNSQIFNGSNVWDHNIYIARDPWSLKFTWDNKYYIATPWSDPPIDKNSTFKYKIDPLMAVSDKPPTAVMVTASPLGGGPEYDSIVITVGMSKFVTVVGGAPTLTLSDGGTAAYVSGSGTRALIFIYKLGSAAGRSANLAITGFTLPPGASIRDVAGNAANMAEISTSFAKISADRPDSKTKPRSLDGTDKSVR